MTYESQTTVNYPVSAKAAIIRPESTTPNALKALAEASAAYSAASQRFIDARYDLEEARTEWNRCRDVASKSAEQENV